MKLPKNSLLFLFVLLTVASVWTWIFTLFPGTSFLLAAPLLIVFLAWSRSSFAIVLALPLSYTTSWQILRYFQDWTPPSEELDNYLIFLVTCFGTASLSFHSRISRQSQIGVPQFLLLSLTSAFAVYVSITIPDTLNSDLANQLIVSPFGLPSSHRCNAWRIGIPAGLVVSSLAMFRFSSFLGDGGDQENGDASESD